MEGDVITMQELFSFERHGMDEDGKVLGRFRASGIRPKFADTLQSRGVELSGALFVERPEGNGYDSAGGSSERGGW